MTEEPADSSNLRGGRKTRSAVTIYDLAQHLNLSPSTVSRALNKPGRISAKTEARIREAAKQLGYRRNPLAGALPTGKTRIVALVISDFSNPAYFEYVRGAEKVASQLGYTLVFTESQESPETEINAVQQLQTSADGILLVASRLSDSDIQELAETKPLVVSNRHVAGVASVAPEVAPGLRQAVEHLHGLGHRYVGYLSGPPASWMNRHRWNLVLNECVSLGISIVEVPTEAPTHDSGARAIDRIRASGVTAVLAYNDLMALGLLKECQRQGVAVPDELSLIGFDNIYGAELTTPALTTVQNPLHAVGEAAMLQLLKEIGDEAGNGQGSLATQLVVRESTSSPRL
ncbi:LacI family DNA-binding transcriptional regulator [Nesterenkonia rhizosphaerae]|uniref:LacI family DNA-binding transcriptional regulator n=1 Tax=Nesterenkonia rhizosphaerae TaxID=1348272 RepID=A0ABP9FUX1_9MICC